MVGGGGNEKPGKGSYDLSANESLKIASQTQDVLPSVKQQQEIETIEVLIS